MLKATYPYVFLRAVLGSSSVHPIYQLLNLIFNDACKNLLSTGMTEVSQVLLQEPFRKAPCSSVNPPVAEGDLTDHSR